MTTTPATETPLAGLPLRAAVAVEVMQWTSLIPSGDDIRGFRVDGCYGRVPHWESDRTAAQQVVQKVEERWDREPFITYLHAPLMRGKGIGCTEFMWTLVNVTAEQICIAALQTARKAVVREQRKGNDEP